MQRFRSFRLMLTTSISAIAFHAAAQTAAPGPVPLAPPAQPEGDAPATAAPLGAQQPAPAAPAAPDAAPPAAPPPAAPLPAAPPPPAGADATAAYSAGSATTVKPGEPMAPPPPLPSEAPPQEAAKPKPGAATTPVVGRWELAIYGFVQFDAIWDSTASFTEISGHANIARPGTYANQHDRYQMSMRNSRFGFRFKAPDLGEVKSSGVLEADFYGPLSSPPEGPLYGTPLPRLRHAYYKAETPVVDVLVGQTWNIFGWQGGSYFPNTAQTPGVRGHVFARSPQLRVSKTVKSSVVTFEAAMAAVRPVQRDSGLPGGQAGMRLGLNEHAGAHTVNVSGSSLVPLSVAVTGDIRRYRVPVFEANATESTSTVGGGVAVDVYVPLIAATETDKDNSLSLYGEIVLGRGINDQYTGFSGGLGQPVLPNPTGATPPPTYTSNFDPGVVGFNRSGDLRLVRWTTYLIGAEYYFPGVDGRLWVAGNYSRSTSDNLADLAGAGATPAESLWFVDGLLGGELLPGVRASAEYAQYRDRYVDGRRAKNHRAQLVSTMVF